MQGAARAEAHKNECARRPRQRDIMRKRLSPYVYTSAAALIMKSTFRVMHEKHHTQFPESKLSLSQFKTMKPWNAKKARRITCNGKTCVNHSVYFPDLAQLADMLNQIIVSFTERCADQKTASSCMHDENGDASKELKTKQLFCSDDGKSDDGGVAKDGGDGGGGAGGARNARGNDSNGSNERHRRQCA
eukprot:129759-Pleurochrysis_carterae.AAC.2